MVTKWSVDDSSAIRSCDSTYTPVLNTTEAYQGFYQGSTAANGFTSFSTSAAYGFGYGAKLATDVAYRSSIYTSGRYRVGDGTSGNSGIGYIGYAGFSLGTGGANSTASPAVASTGGTFALDSDTSFSNMPVAYNPAAVGSNIITNSYNALTWFYRTTGSGSYAISESGMVYGADNKLHLAHYTCTTYTSSTPPTQSYTPSGCVQDFDAGTAGITTPSVLPTTLYSAAGTALPSCVAALKGESATVSDATSPTYMGAYTSGGAITAAVLCSYNGTTYSWLTH